MVDARVHRGNRRASLMKNNGGSRIRRGKIEVEITENPEQRTRMKFHRNHCDSKFFEKKICGYSVTQKN